MTRHSYHLQKYKTRESFFWIKTVFRIRVISLRIGFFSRVRIRIGKKSGSDPENMEPDQSRPKTESTRKNMFNHTQHNIFMVMTVTVTLILYLLLSPWTCVFSIPLHYLVISFNFFLYSFFFVRVSKRVAFDFQSNVPGDFVMHDKKQIPCITSMLTRHTHAHYSSGSM